MSYNGLEIIPIQDEDTKAVVDFFDKIKGDDKFQPHAFTYNYALTLKRTKDLFYIIKEGNVLGYGFIRGLDPPWMDKCLGIYILERREGLGELLMHFLHIVGKRKGLKRIRLHCHPENKPALSLYRKMGYEFNGDKHNNELIGYKYL